MTRPPENGEQTGGRSEAQRKGIAYQGAFEAVTAVLVATGIGYWLDSRFETSPRYLLIGTLVGFGSFVLRLLRLGRQLHADEPPETGDADER